VIGYVGRTGYSANENVNNIETSHLHVGLELVFDESQKESNNEIWVDLYNITKLLAKNQSAVKRVPETKQFYRQFDFKEPNLNK
ncbi:MAG: M23 family peptidase, partial [Oscillospiraceae bacterium]|nr:M23 family peptidase [Oscillospiraceae bacterium]